MGPDPEQVFEAGGDQERDPGALPLEEGVGRDGGPHPEDLDLLWVEGPTQGSPHGLEGRVRVALGVLAQELLDVQGPARVPRDDVREGASAIDVKLPAVTHGRDCNRVTGAAKRWGG